MSDRELEAEFINLLKRANEASVRELLRLMQSEAIRIGLDLSEKTARPEIEL